MSENKDDHEKYFFKPSPERPPWSPPAPENMEAGKIDPADYLTWIDDDRIEEVGDDGSFYIECTWQGPGAGSEHVIREAHSHPFPEIFGFFGYNPENTRDLGGEIELWLEGEKHIITESCLIYIPAGMEHCPLIIREVNRPMFQFTASPKGDYMGQHEKE